MIVFTATYKILSPKPLTVSPFWKPLLMQWLLQSEAVEHGRNPQAILAAGNIKTSSVRPAINQSHHIIYTYFQLE